MISIAWLVSASNSRVFSLSLTCLFKYVTRLSSLGSSDFDLIAVHIVCETYSGDVHVFVHVDVWAADALHPTSIG